MKFFAILCSLITIIAFSISVYFVFDRYGKNKEKEKKSKTIIVSLILVAVSSCLLALTLDFTNDILVQPNTITTDYSEIGPYGDLIGGILNPVIAFIGIIAASLAFYAQYKANQQVQEQFKIQQFESQFYEMLKLHRENVTEMIINGYDFEETKSISADKMEPLKRIEKVTQSRKVFVTMKTELEFILSVYKKHNKLDKEGFQKCYRIFFSGLDEYIKKNTQKDDFVKNLQLARAQHAYPAKTTLTNVERKEFLDLKLNINYKPFTGHSSRLGHYFRHLYLVVKLIVNSETVTDYDDKMNYLRLLRAQLSNHEQILLFYNWLSDYGNDWENKNQQFFTEYCMIHNLWYDNLIEDNFVNEQVEYLRTKKVQLRKGKMFEID